MWRHIASNALTFLVVLAFLLGGVILWGQNEYTSQGPLEDRICLRVKPGSNMRGVSKQLEELGAITNGSIYRVGAEYSGKNSQLKAGSWLVPEAASMQEIVEIVTRGGASSCGTEVVYRIGVTRSDARVRELDPSTDEYVEQAEFDLVEGERPEIYSKVRGENDTRYRIAIAEGVTSWQIINALGQIDVLEGEVAEMPPEGSLAPDSYEISAGDTVASVVERMRTAQDLLLAAAWENRAEGIPLKDPYEALILASIIEKETGVSEERGQVASVFTNRLEQGMKLQTDPTVIYGITEGKRVLGRGLRQSELRKRTDWNTYVIDGLPPTPIANPGRASLEAAVNPEETDFIFFVADGTGGHAFAKTLEEHNQNVAKWRKIEAERATE
ncbi:endolytic transglycosylase MltG [uncultured Roseovarius sp.]|uniref:endolytic transglycosylase MltG n=1 Tax=uncultured Roseovarius sp. TaxID=293344 RepID=UPI002603DCE0|nr:endolytic transglycosylase MltG [uncultured Roseovarius sp.]